MRGPFKGQDMWKDVCVQLRESEPILTCFPYPDS